MMYLKQSYTTPVVDLFVVSEEENFMSPGDFVPGGPGNYTGDEINENDDY